MSMCVWCSGKRELFLQKLIEISDIEEKKKDLLIRELKYKDNGWEKAVSYLKLNYENKVIDGYLEALEDKNIEGFEGRTARVMRVFFDTGCDLGRRPPKKEQVLDIQRKQLDNLKRKLEKQVTQKEQIPQDLFGVDKFSEILSCQIFRLEELSQQIGINLKLEEDITVLSKEIDANYRILNQLNQLNKLKQTQRQSAPSLVFGSSSCSTLNSQKLRVKPVAAGGSKERKKRNIDNYSFSDEKRRRLADEYRRKLPQPQPQPQPQLQQLQQLDQPIVSRKAGGLDPKGMEAACLLSFLRTSAKRANVSGCPSSS
jgi:hypothetical protein